MFGFKKSYIKDDVYKIAMQWGEIDGDAEEQAVSPSEGLLEWIKKNPENKRKLHKAFGIQNGFIAGNFKGEPRDFDSFFKEVIYKTHNYGFMMNYGKSIYKDHMKLQERMDEDYFSGVKEGKEQAKTERNCYLEHRLTYK